MSLRPDVLFITLDQWRFDLLNSGLDLPNLTALAAEGACFARHFCQAYPCSPARAGLITGLYAHKHRVTRNGSPLDARHRTLFQAARAVGYRPMLFGYTDTTPDPRALAAADPARGDYEGVAPGLDVGCLLTESARPWIAHLMRRGHRIDAPAAGRAGVFSQAAFGAPTIFAAEDSETAFLTDSALDHLATQGPEPFFLHLSYIAPHPPFAASREWLARSDPDMLRKPVSSATDHPLLRHYRQTQELSSFAPGLSGPVASAPAAVMRIIRHAYAALAIEVDHHLGRLFDRLRRSGRWQNTVVIVSGDHGEQMFDHGLLGKLGWFDGSARIPLVMRVPSGVPGVQVDALTQSVDVFATLVELLGLDPDPNLDGKSLMPLLRRQPTQWRDAVFWSHEFATPENRHELRLTPRQGQLHVVRTDRFKYVHAPGLPPVLHDLQADAVEAHNLAGSGSAFEREGLERLLEMRLGHEDETFSSMPG